MSIRLRLLLFYLNLVGVSKPPRSPQQARITQHKQLNLYFRLLDYTPIPLFDIKDEKVPMRDGSHIRVRIYRPSPARDLPLIVFYHGGGFVFRSIESHDLVCRRLSQNNQAVVVSVDYRLAPEFKFPVPHQDCYDALVWASSRAGQLGANADQLTVMGDSAGGNLATVVSILSRDAGGPAIKNQVLVYPSTDARMQHPSITRYAKGYFLTRELMSWFLDHYKNSKEDVLNPLMSPLLAKDLSRLPDALVLTAQYDPLKDEGEAYAKRLETAGNRVVFKEFPNVIHGFFNMPKISRECLDAHQAIREFLSQA